MDIIYDKKFFDNFINKLNDNQVNQIYNIKNQLADKPYYMQFKQIIAFYNFKKKLNEDLSKDIQMENNQIVPNIINNKMYLIDKNWIQKWKKHVGFDEIKETCQQYIQNRELNENDYKLIEPFIYKNSRENLLSPLNNNIIFNNNEINVLADFIIVDENCYQLFTVGNKNKTNKLMNKCYTIKIFKDKLILIINENIYLIIFREQKTKSFFELLIIFKEQNSIKNKVLKHLEKDDINEWIKSLKIDLISDIKKSINKNDFVFDLINKTLWSVRNKNLRNTMAPSFIRGAEELLNVNGESISKNLKEQMKTQMKLNLKKMNQNLSEFNNSNNSTNLTQFGNKINNKIYYSRNTNVNDNINKSFMKENNSNEDINKKMEKFINSNQNNVLQNNSNLPNNQINSNNNYINNQYNNNINNNNNSEINT